MRKVALYLICAVALLAGCQPSGPTDPSGVGDNTTANVALASDGDPSPKFQLTSPDGTAIKFDPSQNPDQEAHLIYFWSYRWDPNVKVFMERAAELHERLAPRGLVIIGVAYDEEPAGLRKFMSTNSLPFEIAVGTDAVYRDFKVESIPTAILVDTQGHIAERFTGYYTTEELSDKISKYLPGRTGNSAP